MKLPVLPQSEWAVQTAAFLAASRLPVAAPARHGFQKSLSPRAAAVVGRNPVSCDLTFCLQIPSQPLQN